MKSLQSGVRVNGRSRAEGKGVSKAAYEPPLPSDTNDLPQGWYWVDVECLADVVHKEVELGNFG